MASVTNSPGTMADDATVGTVAWTNPGNAAASDDTYATAGLFADTPSDSSIKIVKADGTFGTTNKSAGAAWSATEAYVSFGSSSDLWGETWASADINDVDFGVVISIVNGLTVSHYLKATNFGFTVPTGVTINGILVEIERKKSGPVENVTASVDHIRITVYYTLTAGTMTNVQSMTNVATLTI